MNWTPEKIQERLDEIKSKPVSGGRLVMYDGEVQSTVVMLDSVPVMARFGQCPPAGAMPVGGGRETPSFAGSLLFLAPDGELWSVPNIWYNQPWSSRIAYFRHCIAGTRKNTEVFEETEQYLAASEKHGMETERRLSDVRWSIRRNIENIAKLERAIRNIETNARLDDCPALNPIEELKDED